MTLNVLLLDVSVIPGGSVTGAAIGIVFFLIFAVVALIAFKMLKRTVKMAFRMAIVAMILLIAVVGAISLMVFSSPSHPVRPTPAQSPRTR